MVIVTLQGGLGNQMFQFAVAKHLSLQNSCQLYLDLSFFSNNTIPNDGFTPRKYELDIFLKQPLTADYLLSKSFYKKKPLQNFIKKWLPIEIKSVFNENSLLFNQSVLNIQSSVLLNGFFQSEKYFKSIQAQLFKIFTFPSLPNNTIPPFLAEIRNTLSVAVHVRRGDFVTSIKTNTYHGVCDTSYYILAMQQIQKKIGSCKFFFFSDDHDWVKQNLISNDSTFLVDTANLPSWYDMYLMTQCKHNIIANSSYSWWGAWLNSNNNKTVIAPKQWFANLDMNSQTSDLIPAEWIKL